MTLTARYQNLNSRFMRLAPRERLLLAAVLLGLLYGLADVLWYAPLAQTRAELTTRAETARAALTRQQAELSMLQGLVARDPFAGLKAQLQQLREAGVELDTQLKTLGGGLTAPGERPALMRRVLELSRGVVMEKVATLPEEVILLAEDAPNLDAKIEQTGGPAIYRQGVALDFSASFSGALAFLNALEALPWQLYFESLEYRVEQYPTARVRLNFYTLAQAEGLWHE